MFNQTINPVLLKLGFLEIRYYGLVYVIGFVLGYFLLRKLVKERHLHIKNEYIIDYMIFLAAGTILGARLFYCLVYNPGYYVYRPWEFVYLWNGGMSFHGGLIGAGISVAWFCKKHNLNLLQMADMSVIPLAIALSLGRVANFVNGELVGRLTTVAWCFQFPGADGCRHPSQLYEAFTNLFIFAFLWGIRGKKLKEGGLFGIFLVMYGSFRTFIGFFREADVQLGYFYGLSIGQIFSMMMIVGGSAWLYFIHKHHKR